MRWRAGWKLYSPNSWQLDNEDIVFRLPRLTPPSCQAVCNIYVEENRGREQRHRESQALIWLATVPNVPKLLPDVPNRTKEGKLLVLIMTPFGREIRSDVRFPVSAHAPIVSSPLCAGLTCSIYSTVMRLHRICLLAMGMCC